MRDQTSDTQHLITNKHVRGTLNVEKVKARFKVLTADQV